jgi:hypothetical protein
MTTETLINEIMNNLPEMQELLARCSQGKATLTEQTKFDFVDVWMNCKRNTGESVFPVETIRAFAVELNLSCNGRDAVDFIH